MFTLRQAQGDSMCCYGEVWECSAEGFGDMVSLFDVWLKIRDVMVNLSNHDSAKSK